MTAKALTYLKWGFFLLFVRNIISALWFADYVSVGRQGKICVLHRCSAYTVKFA